MGKRRGQPKPTPKRTGPTMAEKADRHILYEQAVQSVEDEIEFLGETFTALRSREPILLREDFCGTANAACQWVRVNPEHRSVAVDIDADVLGWGRQHHVAALSAEQKGRVKLVNDDVLTAETEASDLTIAFNFSYWIFKARDTMRSYFRAVHEHLKDDGLFFLDAFGGSEAYEDMKEKTKHNGFTYVWEQAEFDPVTAHCVCHIHFNFPDGSRMVNAFSYAWRLWTLPEVRELLLEAGFKKATVYWEEEEDDDDDDGDYVPVEHGVNDPAWIVYIVAEK